MLVPAKCYHSTWHSLRRHHRPPVTTTAPRPQLPCQSWMPSPHLWPPPPCRLLPAQPRSRLTLTGRTSRQMTRPPLLLLSLPARRRHTLWARCEWTLCRRQQLLCRPRTRLPSSCTLRALGQPRPRSMQPWRHPLVCPDVLHRSSAHSCVEWECNVVHVRDRSCRVLPRCSLPL